MSLILMNYKSIADDYYINRLTNAEIFEKYKLEQKQSNISQERVFEHLPSYKHKNLLCSYCNSELESSYVGKNAYLSNNQLSDLADTNKLKNSPLVRLDVKKKSVRNWTGTGTAYIVDGGHRISVPSCKECGHQLKEKCKCKQCDRSKKSRALEASLILKKELTDFEVLVIDDLPCGLLFWLLKKFSDQIISVNTNNLFVDFKNLSFNEKLNLMYLGVTTLSESSLLSAIKMISINEYYVEWDNVEFVNSNPNFLLKLIISLKQAANTQTNNETGLTNIIVIWEALAVEEVIGVLEHYCRVHDIYYDPDPKLESAIKHSLNRYGLAQTARYIYNSVWNARKYSSEQGFNKYRAFTFIYGNLSFWIDDPRARIYNAPPFTRSDKILSETKEVSIFSRFFLENSNVNYFSDPVCKSAFIKK